MEHIRLVQFSGGVNIAETPVHPKLKVDKRGWVKFGDSNNFPLEALEINGKSTTNRSINNSIKTYLAGKGVKKPIKGYLGAPNSSQDWHAIIKLLAQDYSIFNGFYFQVILNNNEVSVSIHHQDFTQVRVGEIDEAGKPLTFMIHRDWKKASPSNPPEQLEAWQGMENAVKGEVYLYHYWEYEAGLDLYCIPRWHSAVEFVKADGELGGFYLHSIANGFTPSVVVSVPNNPHKDIKREFEDRMTQAFAGKRGANKVITLWGENDAVKPTITPFSASGNADVYNNVEKIIFQRIVSAHQLSSPTLAGVSGSGNLSGNASEIVDSYILFNFTVVEGLRSNLLQALNTFSRINGLATIEIEELDVIAQIQASKSDEVISGIDGEIDTEALATKIGVGGTQVLTSIVENTELSEDTKRGMLKSLFGLSDEEISDILGKKARSTQMSKVSKLVKFLKRIKLWS